MIAILTDPSIGGNFLNWSIYYLAGHSHYYSAINKKLTPVSGNPLTDKNAHNFLANLPDSLEEFNEILGNLLTNQSPYNTIYFHVFSNNHKFPNETSDAIKKLLPHVSKTLLVTVDSNHSLYQCSFFKRSDTGSSFDNLAVKLTTDHEKHFDFVKYWFKSSISVWGESNFNHVWDSREFLALNFRPFDVVKITDHIDLNHDHYAINAIELWDRFDETVGDVFKYLELKINIDNFNKWKTIYQAWKKNHKDRLLFAWYFDTIINYIINGYSLDLARFKLNLYQEAAIQHQLIYKHNLNLKTWQLEKFTNTQQLHELLEPNSHLLSKY